MHKFSKIECQYCERYNIIPKIVPKKRQSQIYYTLINIYIGLGRHDYFFITDATEQHPGWVM